MSRLLSSSAGAFVASCLLGLAFAATASAQFTFGPPVAFPSGETPASVTSADFNGDGYEDVASVGDNTDPFNQFHVWVMLGTGDGTFGSAAGFEVPWAGQRSIVSGDFNGDGDPDLASVNDIDTISVLLGNGDGSFAATTTVVIVGGEKPNSVVSTDFNGDGKQDLATANGGTANLSVLLGNGDGSFGPAANFPSGNGGAPRSITSADFNRDGKMDLAAAAASDSTISILLGDGDGGFGSAAFRDAGLATQSVISADFNGDSFPDLAAASLSGIAVLLGNGDGSFGAITEFDVETGSTAVASADFNGDNILDLVSTSGYNVRFLLGKGDGTFGQAVSFTSAIPFSFAPADYNGDGAQDVASANYYGSSISVMINSAAVGLSPSDLAFPTTVPGTASPPQAATITNDGSAPLMVNGFEVTGADINDFLIGSDSCQQAVQPGVSCEVNLTFAPGSEGDSSAVLEVKSNALTATSVSLTGVGQIPAAKISKVIVKGPKKVKKKKKATYKVKITNSGNVKAKGVKLKVDGKGVKAKKSVGTIAAGKTKTVKVKLKPKKPGKVKIKFKVTSENAGGRTVKKKINVRK